MDGNEAGLPLKLNVAFIQFDQKELRWVWIGTRKGTINSKNCHFLVNSVLK